MKTSAGAGRRAARQVVAPVSLVVTAFAPVAVRASLTPQLRTDAGDSVLILIDLGVASPHG